MHKEGRLLRIGVLGCGPIAQIGHFEAIRKSRNAELYAICDAAPDLLARMRAIHEPTVAYTDYDAMLGDPRVEAIVVAVADQFHVALSVRALEAGKPVFVEKPFGVNVDEAEELRRQVRSSGLPLQVGHNQRFDPGITYARQFILEELGEMMALKAWYCDSTYRYTMTDNVQAIVIQSTAAIKPAGNPKADRRQYYMLGHGSHLVDLARFLGGEIVSVRAKLVEKFGAYCWFASVDFARGAAGHLDLTIAVRGDFEGGFRIYGENGSVNARTHLPWFHKTAEVECFSTRDSTFHRPLGEDAFAYRRQIEGFADTILHGVPQHGANVDDGVASVRAMVALARSAETGQTVRLEDVTGEV